MKALSVLVAPHPLSDGDPRPYGYRSARLVETDDPTALRDQLRADSDASVAVITGPLATEPARLILSDVDSTLTTTEAIDLLATHAGRGEQVAEVTERAMRGELDFEESLRERVAALAGLPTSVFDEVAPQMTLSPGAEDLIRTAHDQGCLVGVTSGGFRQLVGPLAERLGLDFWNAIQLEERDGVLTGGVEGPVVDKEQKIRDLHRFAEQAGVPLSHTVAVGDGANDLGMLGAAGLGIAYCAKPVTAAAADVALGFPRLDAVAGFALER